MPRLTTSDHGTVIISRLLAGVAVLGALAVGLLYVGAPTPARAAAARPCVGVVVDAQQMGGAVRTGCAVGDPRTGLAALANAGFGYTPRPRDGLICQIDAQPASCTATTSTTYWSYWYRAPGSHTWVYANQGAGTHDPKPGSTEGWVWQDGGRRPPPDIALATICPQVAASPTPAPTTSPKPKPKPTPTPTRTTHRPKPTHRPTATHRPTDRPTRPPTTTPAAGAGSAAGGTHRKRSASATPTPRPTRSPTPSATSATSPPTPSASSAAAVTTSPAAATGPEPDGSGGPALPKAAGAAVGGALVIGLGAAAYVRSRRSGP